MTKERVLELLEKTLHDPNGNLSVGESQALAIAINIIGEQASPKWAYFREGAR